MQPRPHTIATSPFDPQTQLMFSSCNLICHLHSGLDCPRLQSPTDAGGDVGSLSSSSTVLPLPPQDPLACSGYRTSRGQPRRRDTPPLLLFSPWAQLLPKEGGCLTSTLRTDPRKQGRRLSASSGAGRPRPLSPLLPPSLPLHPNPEPIRPVLLQTTTPKNPSSPPRQGFAPFPPRSHFPTLHSPCIKSQRSRASPSYLLSLSPNSPYMHNELSTTYLPRPLQTSPFFPGCPASFGPPERKNGLRPFPFGPCPFQLHLPIPLITFCLPLDSHSNTYLYPSWILQDSLPFLALIYPLT